MRMDRKINGKTTKNIPNRKTGRHPRFRRLVSLMAAALLAVSPGFGALQVSAAEPTSFYIKFDIDRGDWRMQTGSWDEENEGRELYYLNEGSGKLKDGDILIILPNDTDPEAEDQQQQAGSTITINARLSNLTVNRAHVVISTKGVDECHVLGDSYASVGGDIANAYVYDNGICTFNNNVTNLRLISSEKNTVRTEVSVAGTVGYCSVANPGGIYEQYYNFAAGTFFFTAGSGLMTDPANYSKDGTAPAASTPAASSAPAQNPAPAQASSGEYDDVPKTGESSLVLWLFLFSGVCLAGHLMMRKRI
ncbi:MAG: hypothetical protein NC399_10820 [Muribaculum sp.]|nr:hypothetical protein [Muribaculum sp.]